MFLMLKTFLPNTLLLYWCQVYSNANKIYIVRKLLAISKFWQHLRFHSMLCFYPTGIQQFASYFGAIALKKILLYFTANVERVRNKNLKFFPFEFKCDIILRNYVKMQMSIADGRLFIQRYSIRIIFFVCIYSISRICIYNDHKLYQQQTIFIS